MLLHILLCNSVIPPCNPLTNTVNSLTFYSSYLIIIISVGFCTLRIALPLNILSVSKNCSRSSSRIINYNRTVTVIFPQISVSGFWSGIRTWHHLGLFQLTLLRTEIRRLVISILKHELGLRTSIQLILIIVQFGQ
jgi:hypothetical protein